MHNTNNSDVKIDNSFTVGKDVLGHHMPQHANNDVLPTTPTITQLWPDHCFLYGLTLKYRQNIGANKSVAMQSGWGGGCRYHRPNFSNYKLNSFWQTIKIGNWTAYSYSGHKAL